MCFKYFGGDTRLSGTRQSRDVSIRGTRCYMTTSLALGLSGARVSLGIPNDLITRRMSGHAPRKAINGRD